MLDAVMPNLKVEGLALSPKGAAFDLRAFLYKGVAGLGRRRAQSKLESGQLGRPLMERLPLLQAIHQRWQAGVRSNSLSRATIATEWQGLADFVAFADRSDSKLTPGNVERTYLAWGAHVAARSGVSGGVKYAQAMNVARVICPATDLTAKRLLWKTKIIKPKKCGASGAKENLKDTGVFIQLMLETIRQLPVEVIRGPLPAMLRFGETEYPIDCRFRRFKPIDSLKQQDPYFLKKAKEARERNSRDTSNRKRAQLINLRLEAEMLVFINQTSCNLTQALQLTGGKFRYQSDGDYVWIRPWKMRARHAVELRINKGYRPWFEAFLKWREAIFPGDPEGLTFPFIISDGDMAMRRTSYTFNQARRLCKALGRPFVSSMQHRKTVGNFVKRRADRQMAAELLSNDSRTFQEHYEEPDHQRGAAELVHFFDTLEGMVGEAVGPGGCQEGKPTPLQDAPPAAPKPDCEGGAGCLFCLKNRDLRSFDHAWNLASFHHLKLLEFNADRTSLSLKGNHPVLLTAERAAAKLDAMACEDAECSEWVAEARLRVQEGRYHLHYIENFEALEGDA